MPLSEHLDRLAAFEPTTLPVISLYLNTQPDQHGRANFESFVLKEFCARAKGYRLRSPERESFERDAERIKAYLQNELRPSANGLALFACAGEDNFFEAVCNSMLRSTNTPSTSIINRISIRWRA